MNPKNQAIHDIRQELKTSGRSFIMFHKELDTPIQNLVQNQIKKQETKKKKPVTKFSIGDTITSIYQGRGVPKATIIGFQDKYYKCKIMNGIALIPISAEINYKILNP